jgi:hypothetical protein
MMGTSSAALPLRVRCVLVLSGPWKITVDPYLLTTHPRGARARHSEAIARLASSHAPCAVTSLCGPYTVRMASHTSPKHCPACSMPPSWQMLPALGWRALPACSPRAPDRCPCKLPRSARCPNPSPGLQAMWFTNSDHIGAHCDVHATQHYGSSYGVTSDETKGAT